MEQQLYLFVGKIMKTIIRKTMLYKTGVEYGDYTVNHVQGCSHGCKYPCYAMMLAKRYRVRASDFISISDMPLPEFAISFLPAIMYVVR